MRKYLYDKFNGNITFLDTLEVITLNESSRYIFETANTASSLDQVVDLVSDQYDAPHKELQLDCTEVINNLNDYGLVFFNNSKDLLIQNKDENDTSFKVAIVHIIKNCNSKCIMCDCWRDTRDTRHGRLQLIPFFEKLKTFNTESVMLTGGEPLLHPELPQIIEDINNLGMKVELNTNATLLDELAAKKVKNISSLIVSMDGHDDLTYKKIRGIDSYSKVWENIRNFKKLYPKIHIGIRVTLTRYNLFQLDKIVNHALDNGVSSIGFSPLDTDSDSFGRDNSSLEKSLKRSNRLLPTDQEIAIYLNNFNINNPFYRHISELAKENKSQWSTKEIVDCLNFYSQLNNGHKHKFDSNPCLFPNLSMVLDYNGDFKTCFYSESFGHLSSPAKASWSLEKRTKQLKENSSCSDCRGKVFCGYSS